MDVTTTNTTATTATIDNALSGSDITSITYAGGTGTITSLQNTGAIAISPSYYATTADNWFPNTHHDWVGLEQMCTDEEWEKFSEELCLEKLDKEEYVY